MAIKIWGERAEIEGAIRVEFKATINGNPINCRYAIGLGVGRQASALADRLISAINAGAVCSNVKPACDINGADYLAFSVAVQGRRLNADLKALGY